MSKQAERKRAARQRAQQQRNRRRAVAEGHDAASPQAKRESSLYRDLPADKVALLNRVDGFSGLRNGLRMIARERGDWAGIPMPISGMRLVIEPHHPKAAELAEIGAPPEPEEADDDLKGAKERNRFWCLKKNGEVIIFEMADGKIDWGVHRSDALTMALEALRAADAWGIEQEGRAVQLLGTLLPHRQFKNYLLTGMFMEASKRSGVHYLFRRLRPTVAITTRNDRVKILCALCLHPIAYYSGSWAGAMTPTDDVVAHLMLMRGDEHMFWRRANQHAPWRQEAGLR